MTTAALRNETEARRLADVLPPLAVEAQRIAATVMMGAHGLRRAGPGTTFWAYRAYVAGDNTQRIDWRKSAKVNAPFIREVEWEAANTLWLWVNRGPRMNFKSHLARETKLHHASVLGLAMAALAIRSHERVGLLEGSNKAGHGRQILPRMALELSAANNGRLPNPGLLHRRATALLVSDFLDEPNAIKAALQGLASASIHCHLVQVNDPAEETLPYDGHIEFTGFEGNLRYKAGKAESLRQAYASAFANQRESVRGIARSLGFTFTQHRTDQPLAKAVLSLHQRIGPN